MKKILFLILLVIFAGSITYAQVTTPIVKANFGIEADPSANFYNNAPQPAVDDWFSNGYLGTGQFIIDTTGAAGIVAGYTTNPASRLRSFSRVMRQAPYSLVNNRLLLDAIFHRDFHGQDSTVYASGSNKNGMSPASWTCPVAQGIPDKNDILDAYTHVRRAGPNVTDSLWMFSAISIENTTGSRYFDFELYQTDITYDRATRTFQNYGPDAGHTSWKFDAAGNIISAGDIVFTAEFGTASITMVQARIWIDRASLSIIPNSFNWGGQFDGASAGARFGYASILPKSLGAFYTGIQCTVAATWAGPFALVREDNSVTTNYIAKQFMEFSVNLTKLGIEPANFSNNPCGSPFRRVLIKTRSSTSFTAELKDFIAPYRMFDYPQVDADAFIRYYCEVMPTTTISVNNVIATSSYNWSTTNGNIVGPTTGPSITVNAPGTYWVTQRLHTACPAMAMDSVTIFFDSVCQILNVDLRRFDVYKQPTAAELRWQVSNNEQVDAFEVEYSLNNQAFDLLVSLPSNSRTGLAEYSLTHPFNNIDAEYIFYRIRIIGKDGKIKYSETRKIMLDKGSSEHIFIYPNPVRDAAWLSLQAPIKTTAVITILDNNGRLINSWKQVANKGFNLLHLEQLTKLQPGVYIVKVVAGAEEKTQKIIVMK